MPRKKTRKGAGRKKESAPDLTELRKAGEHFIMGAMEFVVGTGFAVKGMKELMENEDGRKLIRDFPSRAASRGFDLLVRARDQMKARAKSGDGAKRSRKIDIE